MPRKIKKPKKTKRKYKHKKRSQTRNTKTKRKIKGKGFLTNLITGQILPPKIGKTSSGWPRSYAQFAAVTYKNIKPGSLHHDYYLVPEFTMGRIATYSNNQMEEIVLAIRGTDAKVMKDILADITVFFGQINITPEYKEAEYILKKILSDPVYSKYKIIITGHSLGGSIGRELLIKYTPYIHAFYAYAPGTTNAHVQYIQKLQRLNLEHAHEIASKTFYEIVNLDPISYMAAYELPTRTKYIKAKRGKNPHTIDNFVI